MMKLMGIEKSVRAGLCHEPGTRMVDSRGRSQGFIATNTSGKDRQTISCEIEIMRRDLINILYEQTKDRDNVKHIFNCKIEHFVQDEGDPSGKVHVSFSDGRNEDFDIVVGADGINSQTRQIMLGASAPDPRRDLGMHIAFFTAPTKDGDTNDFTACSMPVGKLLMLRKDNPDNIRVYLMARRGCKTLDKATTLQEQKKALTELFKGADGWQVDRFWRDLVESPMADDIYSHHEMSVRLPEGMWSKGRVVLLGDAADGSGTNGWEITSALIQAYVLCGEIATRWERSRDSQKPLAFQDATKEFERIIRPLIKDRPSIVPKIVLPDSQFGIRAMHFFIWFITTTKIFACLSPFLPPEQPGKLEYKDYFGLRSQYGV